jgi:ABC-type Fe3+-hydroxamate transport system substrate-binding protein
MIAAGGTYISTLLESIDLKNSFAANKIAYPVLDGESLLRENPDIVFDMSHDGGGRDFLGRKVIMIGIQDFLAAPQSIKALRVLVEQHAGKPHTE